VATQFKETIIETFKLDRENVDKVIGKIEELIHEGNVRRVIVKDARGVTFIEVPLTIGLVGVALVPVWAAIGAIAALVSDFTTLRRAERSHPREDADRSARRRVVRRSVGSAAPRARPMPAPGHRASRRTRRAAPRWSGGVRAAHALLRARVAQ